ncbi:MAG TPA: AI-2E family transporter [Candidatus Saccharimonadales bacterium]|nr:AI-2E family transporter [Candidatus Saccharimonadales bacterium]
MISRKTLFFIALGVILFILYLARSILMPFILAGIFAYIFSPLVDYLEHRVKIPRIWSIILLYLSFFVLAVFFFVWVFSAAVNETRDLTAEINEINSLGTQTFQNLPDIVIAGQHFGLKPIVEESLKTTVHSIAHFQGSLFPVFSEVVRYGLRFLIFWVVAFYLLKDGKILFEAVGRKFSKESEKEIQEVGRRINVVLGGYLRGQIILILLMATVSTIFLTIMGVKFAIVLGILTGFLELIPFAGPIIATTIVAGVAFITGSNNWGLDPVMLSLIIVIVYFVFRQFEDYFVIPQVLGRLTRIHPLLVLMSVLIGGAIAGPIGFVLGVPFAVSGKVLLEYFWEKAN